MLKIYYNMTLKQTNVILRKE